MCFPLLAVPAAGALGGLASAGAGVGAGIAAGTATAAGTAAAGTAAAGISLTTATQIAGLALSLGGTLLGAKQTSDTADANAEMAAAQADDARAAATVEENRSRLRYRKLLGEQRAQLAGNGIALDSSAALLLGDDLIDEREFEAQQIRNTGGGTGARLDTEANLYRAQAVKARLGGALGAGSSILNAPSSLWAGFGGSGTAPGQITAPV